MDDINFIKKFSKITISGICRKYNIDRTNLMNNRTKLENFKIIREEIESEYAKLYIKKEDKNDRYL